MHKHLRCASSSTQPLIGWNGNCLEQLTVPKETERSSLW